MSTTSLTRWTTLTTLPLLLFGLAACSSAGTSDETEKTRTSTTSKDWDLAHAKCMRDAGFDIKDPGAEGSGVVKLDDQGGNFLEGEKSCTDEVTNKLGKRPVSDAEKKDKEEWLERSAKVADCLRKQGYDVPGPEESSGKTGDLASVPEQAFEKCGAPLPDKVTGGGK